MIRVVHYVNQYFAGIGGEDASSHPPSALPGLAGASRALQARLADRATVVATVFAGDNYVAEHEQSAIADCVSLIATYGPTVCVAGPAFGSGRYGLACGLVCEAVGRTLEVPTLTGMYPENPGVDACRRTTIVVPTAETVRGMGEALERMAELVVKLGTGAELGPAEAEGYLPKGIRVNELAGEVAGVRAVELVLRKLRGETETEWPLPRYERVRPAAAVAQGKRPRVALVSEGAVVPKGNPDNLPSGWCSAWAKYEVNAMDTLSNAEFETVHGGFDTTNGNHDPNRLVPLDALRELEREGRVEVWRDLYVTNGNMGSLTEMSRIGSEMAHVLRQDGVDVAIIGAT